MAAFPFMANERGPEWLPAAAREARQFAYWGQLILFLFTIIAAVLVPVTLVTGAWGSTVYFALSVVVDIILLTQLNQTVFEPLDQGKFKEVNDRLLLWAIIGIIFAMVVPGLLLLLAYLKLQEVFQPQYQQYPTQYYQTPQPYSGQPAAQQPGQQYQAPPPQPVAPAQNQAPPPASEAQQQGKPDMIKCKNCGVQYPSFMRNCPSCGAPRN